MSEIKDKESWHGHTNAEVENYIKNRLDNSAGCKKILYAKLKELRDNGKLIPGMQYRITDYECTTTEEDTRSAGHQFDIIVTADDEKTLNENARAIQHDGDEYFSNSNLAAWELKYCLDNDTNRFNWADVTNGKGVIYRLIDEFNNDIPYDFKNIQFKHSLDTIKYPYYYYTFASDNIENNTDASINSNTINRDVYNNTMGIYIKFGVNGNVLNRNLFFKNSTHDNTFGSNCHNNIFEYSCQNNIFGNNCHNNTFLDTCYNNIFGNDCYRNVLGSMCIYNIFGNKCYYNTLGNACLQNTFGNNCNFNTFGRRFQNNIFGNDVNNINVQKDGVCYIIIENGNQYINITSVATISSSDKLMNFTIAQGVNNTETVKTISHDTVNDTFKTTYQPANSVVVNI